MEPFASVPEQPEAKRLLSAALENGGAHAYLLHGPAGVGKRSAAFAFAAALLGDERRVEARAHPDLYILEPLGEMIRIDDVRALIREMIEIGRVKADGGIDLRMGLCQPDCSQAGLMIQGRDQDAPNSSFPRSLNDRFTVFVELVEIEMAVGIGKHRTTIVKIITY